MINATQAAIAVGHDFEVGEILAGRWGYEQTNIDYYQIVRVTPSTVMVQQLNKRSTATGDMTSKSQPIPGAFADGSKPFRKTPRRRSRGGECYIGLTHGTASRTDPSIWTNETHYA